LHSFGKEASEAVEKARKIAADYFGATEEEIIFTSGATEANNFAIKGVLRKWKSDPRNKNMIPHIITTTIEHSCVLNTCQKLEIEGKVEVTYLPVYADGIVKVSDVKNAIRENTVLVSVMCANNEIGTIQPIAEIGKLLKALNSSRQEKIFFHSDATQAIAYLDCDVQRLGLDLLSMSAHKIYGPKGVGLLYIRKGTPISRIQDGGEQEFLLRAGTINSTGIVGLGKALELIKKNKQNNIKHIIKLQAQVIQKIEKNISDVLINGALEKRLPNNINVSFLRVEGESLLLFLDSEGIACSTGSACSSGSLKPSHVLLALGRKPEEAHGSLRITLGKDTTKEEIALFISKLKTIIAKLRKISGSVLADYYMQKK
jgi:cysteine desulfurase